MQEFKVLYIGLGALLLSSTLGRADYIYASCANWGYGGASVVEFDSRGNGSVFASLGAYSPEGIAFDSSGNLYLACAANNTIMRFDPSGQGSVFASTGLSGPNGLAFDRNGNLYAADWGGTITRFDPSGQASVFASLSSLGAGWRWSSSLSGLAFDSSGNLWVASYDDYFHSIFGDTDYGGSIREFNPSGHQLLQVSLNSPTGLAFDRNGNLYVSSWNTGTITEFDPSGNSSTFASGCGYADGLAFDSSGNLYVAGGANNMII
jgi:sugar lactone lactonase YvrE